MEEARGDENELMVPCVTHGGEPVGNTSLKGAHGCLLTPRLLTEAAMKPELQAEGTVSPRAHEKGWENKEIDDASPDLNTGAPGVEVLMLGRW